MNLQLEEANDEDDGKNNCICPQHIQLLHPDTSGSLNSNKTESSKEPMSPDTVSLECLEVLSDDISNDENPSPNAVERPLDQQAFMKLESDYNSLKRRCSRMEKRIQKAKEFQERHYKFKKESKLLHMRKDRTISGLERTLKDVLTVKL